MNKSLKLSKLDGGLKSIDLLLKNLEYKFEEEISYSDHFILCQGDILKINEVENSNLYFTSGVDGKLDMSYLPSEITRCDEVEISLFERLKLIKKNYEIFGPRFEVSFDLPIGVIRTINEKIKENYVKENFSVNMRLSFIKPIYETYKTGFSTIDQDDKVIIYLGEEYQDDDSDYGRNGEAKVNINISHENPYDLGNNKKTINLFSFYL